MSKIGYLPLDEAQRLSALLPKSKYKQYGNNSYVVYYHGDLFHADRIIAVITGVSIFSAGKWKLKVNIKFREKQHLQEQNIRNFLKQRTSELAVEGGELKAA